VDAQPPAWELLVGDPTPLGWIAFFAYLSAGWLCWRAYRAASASPAQARAWFWALLALLMLVLGLNKQLDLQTALIHAGRAVVRGRTAMSRGEASVYAAFALAVAGAAGLYVLVRLSWPPAADQGLALAGLAGLVCYVLLRVSDFQRVPIFVGARLLEWSWLVEFAAIALVGAGAAARSRRAARPAR
jgi:hypothetical protein